MPTIKYTREDITKLENERDQYKRERDSLIKDVEKLREEVKSLNRETTKYFEHWQEIFGIYSKLTEHIKDKALNNPSEHRYFRLVHFIDDLEADTHEG
ncbi:hypothetical protein ACW7DJ_02205 [Mammaliicoccus sciuri]